MAFTKELIVESYDHLLTLEQDGAPNFIPEGTKKRYGVAALLDGIEDAWLREFGESHLHPPQFKVAPETSFPDAWEVFCCDVLNRHEKNVEIRRRKPPETGVDLYWPARKSAYQCKSVVDPDGKFNPSMAADSLKSALTIRDTLPWRKYVLCTNVALTGPQEQTLRDIFPDIEFLTPSFWIPRCRDQSEHLSGRFQRLEPMDARRALRTTALQGSGQVWLGIPRSELDALTATASCGKLETLGSVEV